MKYKLYLCKQCGEKDINMFYITHKNICKKCVIDKQKQKYHLQNLEDKRIWYNNNLIKVKLAAAKYRANKKNLEFNLEVEDIEFLLKQQNNRCYYSNIEFDINSKQYSYSIDRTDSSKGYTLDNIKLVCSIVNIMKHNLDEEEFLIILKKILKNML